MNLFDLHACVYTESEDKGLHSQRKAQTAMEAKRPRGNSYKSPPANADRLKEIRKLLGLTQGEMADKLGIVPTSYARYEYGIRSVRDEVLQMAEKLLASGGRKPHPQHWHGKQDKERRREMKQERQESREIAETVSA
jgi:transcriptional regulator with XRE-family HTH domain